MTAAVAVGILVAGGVFLICQRGLLRVVFGFVLLGHAANLILISAGGMSRREAPLLGTTDGGDAADPLVQAFVLTAIVITFGITVYLLALIRAGDEAGRMPEPPETDSDPQPAADPALAEPGLGTRAAEPPSGGDRT